MTLHKLTFTSLFHSDRGFCMNNLSCVQPTQLMRMSMWSCCSIIEWIAWWTLSGEVTSVWMDIHFASDRITWKHNNHVIILIKILGDNPYTQQLNKFNQFITYMDASAVLWCTHFWPYVCRHLIWQRYIPREQTGVRSVDRYYWHHLLQRLRDLQGRQWHTRIHINIMEGMQSLQ